MSSRIVHGRAMIESKCQRCQLPAGRAGDGRTGGGILGWGTSPGYLRRVGTTGPPSCGARASGLFSTTGPRVPPGPTSHRQAPPVRIRRKFLLNRFRTVDNAVMSGQCTDAKAVVRSRRGQQPARPVLSNDTIPPATRGRQKENDSAVMCGHSWEVQEEHRAGLHAEPVLRRHHRPARARPWFGVKGHRNGDQRRRQGRQRGAGGRRADRCRTGQAGRIPGRR